MKKRLISCLLALALAAGLGSALPATAGAADQVSCTGWWCSDGTVFITELKLNGQPLGKSLEGLTPGETVTLEGKTIDHYRCGSVAVLPEGADSEVYFFEDTSTPSVTAAQIKVPDKDFKLRIGIDSIGYVVSYYTDKGSEIETIRYDYDTTVTVKGPKDFSPALEKPGYTFTGWNTTYNGTGDTFQPGDTVQAENKYSRNGKSFFAQWREDGANTVTVDGGKADRTAAKKGETVTVTAAEKENFTFDHWDVVSGGVTPADRASAATTFVMGDQDVSLKAVNKYSGPMLTDFYVYIVPPVAGRHPQPPTVESDDYQVSAYSWVWITSEGSGKMTKDDVFKEGSDILYQCKVDLSIPKLMADEADKLHGYVNDSAKTDGGIDVMIFRSSFAKVKVVGSFNCAPAAQPNPFKDVQEGDYFYDAVLWAYYAAPQVTKGVSDTYFGPGSTVTRGQCVTFLWRAMGEPEPTSAKNPFTDVKESDYYYKAVLWAVENNITVGVTPTQFVPSQTCSTAHIITFLYRTLGVGSNGWYEEAGSWAAKDNLLDGTGLTVSPGVNCPRGAVVTFLCRELAR